MANEWEKEEAKTKCKKKLNPDRMGLTDSKNSAQIK